MLCGGAVRQQCRLTICIELDELKNSVSDNKIQISILILRRGALSIHPSLGSPDFLVSLSSLVPFVFHSTHFSNKGEFIFSLFYPAAKAELQIEINWTFPACKTLLNPHSKWLMSGLTEILSKKTSYPLVLPRQKSWGEQRGDPICAAAQSSSQLICPRLSLSFCALSL